MTGRAARTRAALDAMDPQQRLAMEGHRPGAYLRLRFTGARRAAPCSCVLGACHWRRGMHAICMFSRGSMRGCTGVCGCSVSAHAVRKLCLFVRAWWCHPLALVIVKAEYMS